MESRLIVAYGLIALVVLGGIVAARVLWYRSWPQRSAREHKRELRRIERRRQEAAARAGL